MNIIELKSNCIQRCNSRKAHLNSLNALQRNYKIRLEDDIERKLKEERSNIVEFFENEEIIISSQSKNETEVIDIVTLALPHGFRTFFFWLNWCINLKKKKSCMYTTPLTSINSLSTIKNGGSVHES